LKSRFTIVEQQKPAANSLWRIAARPILLRIRYLFRTLWHVMSARRLAAAPGQRFDVAFAGLWDWSVQWDEFSGVLVDRYVRDLPTVLDRQGISSGWFAWWDPMPGWWRNFRAAEERLAPAARASNLIILQALLRPWEVVRQAMDWRPLLLFLSVHRCAGFQEAFREGGDDFLPVFAERLLSGFLDESLPHHQLVALATERACRRCAPRVFVSFLEHFPYARAQYAGVQYSGDGTVTVAIQHASYNRDKTALFLDPSRELLGQPDGQTIPHPTHVCVLGSLGQELFLACGYHPSRLTVTGSPRYSDTRLVAVGAPGDPDRASGCKPFHLLIVSTINTDLDIELLDAACAAVRHLDRVSVRLRNHPIRRLDQHPAFARYRDRVEVTAGSLADDLSRADLILFTYSMVAEEAFLQGKPVVQWRPWGFDGSALAEVTKIPRVCSIEELQEAIVRYRERPDLFLPSRAAQQLVMERLFADNPSLASQRIANQVIGPLVSEWALGHRGDASTAHRAVASAF